MRSNQKLSLHILLCLVLSLSSIQSPMYAANNDYDAHEGKKSSSSLQKTSLSDRSFTKKNKSPFPKAAFF